MRVGQETFADRLSAITSNFPISTWSWTSVSTTEPSSISRSKPPPTASLLETCRQLALHEDTMSSGNVELLGDNVEILDYEPEGEDPTAEQFPAASAEDESPPMSMVFTVDDLLDNIATADPAELERAHNTGRVSLEDIVEAAHLSSDSPLFVPPFSLPPEDRLILAPRRDYGVPTVERDVVRRSCREDSRGGGARAGEARGRGALGGTGGCSGCCGEEAGGGA
ncbi:unnamed protein product [Ectocarpus sp. CCAP 1310/34]|nr:unnamed protein product [Ectocarpus sp. CCAP 1310/34]